MEWRDRAACLAEDVDPEIFFALSDLDVETIARAKAVCSTCPVTAECLEFAVDNDIQHGVWGGMSEWERGAAHRDRTRRAYREKRARRAG